MGWNLPLQDGVYMGLATLEKPLELTKKFQCSAGILKTFIFASTTALATVFVPLGRKAFLVLSSLLNGKLIEQL